MDFNTWFYKHWYIFVGISFIVYFIARSISPSWAMFWAIFGSYGLTYVVYKIQKDDGHDSSED